MIKGPICVGSYNDLGFMIKGPICVGSYNDLGFYD